MTKNPILNALAAVGYITLFAVLLTTWSTLTTSDPNPVAAIVAFLSLFVFSATVMAYLVLYAPLRLLLDGDAEGAIKLFFKTLVAFASIAVLVFLASLLLPGSYFGK